MSDVDLSGLISCNYGTSSLQVETAGVEEEPIVKEDQGRVGTNVTVRVDAYVQGDDAPDLEAKLAAVYGNLLLDGRDFLLSGIAGTVLLLLPAAACLEGGPHVKYTGTLSPKVPVRMDFKLEVQAKQPYDPKKTGKPIDTWKLTVKVRADGLREITRTGDVLGANTPAYFLNAVLPAFQAAFPLPQWVTTFEYSNSGDSNESHLSYSTNARELANTLPAAGGAHAVDGDFSIQTDRDEQLRLNTTYTWDVVVVGDLNGMVGALRQQAMGLAGGSPIFKENVSTSWIQAQRVRASFTTLQAAGGNALMNFQESIALEPDWPTYDIKTYPGADPLAVQKPKGAQRLVQVGSATSQGAYLVAQSPFFDSFLEPPELTYEDLGDGVQYRTSWRYVMYVADVGLKIAAQLFNVRSNVRHIRRQEVDGFFTPM